MTDVSPNVAPPRPSLAARLTCTRSAWPLRLSGAALWIAPRVQPPGGCAIWSSPPAAATVEPSAETVQRDGSRVAAEKSSANAGVGVGVGLGVELGVGVGVGL